LLFLAGCQPEKAPIIQLKDFSDDGSSHVIGEPKPAYREVTDEFGVVKGWMF